MPSKAENISTSLREAMWVGCPCVTALVGAVPELAHHGKTALCYRYEEYEVLAYEIMKLLNDPELANILAHNGHNLIQERYPMTQPLSGCADWYEKMFRRKGV
jgi:glycosyltransferase involved in cell wall biosynthesis